MIAPAADEPPEREPGPSEQPWLPDRARLNAAWRSMHAYFCVRGLSAEADDLAQMTYVRFLVWQGTHPGEEPRPNFEGFLNANAGFERRDHLRRLYRDRTQVIGDSTDVAAVQDGRLLASSDFFVEEMVGSACGGALVSAITALTELQREVLLAHYLDGHAAGHIASLRGVSEQAVRRAIRAALGTLGDSPLLKPYNRKLRRGGDQ